MQEKVETTALVLAREQCNLLMELRELFEILDIAPPDNVMPPRGGLIPTIAIAICRTQEAREMVKAATSTCEVAMKLLEGEDRPGRVPA